MEEEDGATAGSVQGFIEKRDIRNSLLIAAGLSPSLGVVERKRLDLGNKNPIYERGLTS